LKTDEEYSVTRSGRKRKNDHSESVIVVSSTNRQCLIAKENSTAPALTEEVFMKLKQEVNIIFEFLFY
jgi:hypothetical protein